MSDHDEQPYGEEFPGTTLEEAKEWLRARLPEGDVCPCCNRYARLYRRKLNRGMARSLVNMYHYGGTDWQIVHSTKEREETKLRHYGFVQVGKDRGLMRVLPRGVDFIYGRLHVLSHFDEYDGRCILIHGSSVGIRDVLQMPFDYAELMSERGTGLPW